MTLVSQRAAPRGKEGVLLGLSASPQQLLHDADPVKLPGDGQVPLLALAVALALQPEPPGDVVHLLPLVVGEAGGEDEVVGRVAGHPLLHHLGHPLLEVGPHAAAAEPLPPEHGGGGDGLGAARPVPAEAPAAPAHQTQQLVAHVGGAQGRGLLPHPRVDLHIDEVDLGAV